MLTHADLPDAHPCQGTQHLCQWWLHRIHRCRSDLAHRLPAHPVPDLLHLHGYQSGVHRRTFSSTPARYGTDKRFELLAVFFPETKGKTLEEMDNLFEKQTVNHEHGNAQLSGEPYKTGALPTSQKRVPENE